MSDDEKLARSKARAVGKVTTAFMLQNGFTALDLHFINTMKDEQLQNLLLCLQDYSIRADDIFGYFDDSKESNYLRDRFRTTKIPLQERIDTRILQRFEISSGLSDQAIQAMFEPEMMTLQRFLRTFYHLVVNREATEYLHGFDELDKTKKYVAHVGYLKEGSTRSQDIIPMSFSIYWNHHSWEVYPREFSIGEDKTNPAGTVLLHYRYAV